MKKLQEINGYVKITLDKLPGTRMGGWGEDSVTLDNDWQEKGFPELIEVLRKWSYSIKGLYYNT